MARRAKGRLPRVGGILLLLLLLAAGAWIVWISLLTSARSRPTTEAMALADLDGDGDLDAFLANAVSEQYEPNTVLWNDGRGHFEDSGQRLGEAESLSVVLYDIDDDGDADAVVSNTAGGHYFWNDGRGDFSAHRAIWVREMREAVGVWRFFPAELNGDGRSDLFLAGCCGGAISRGPDDVTWVRSFNAVWLHQGEAIPQNTENSVQTFGNGSTLAVALADLDGDGDVDAFGANNLFHDEAGETASDPNQVWFNDGQGVFVDSGQRLGDQRSTAVAVGDLDGDGDVDALVGNQGPDEVWWNDGNGHFVDSGQQLSDGLTRLLYLADFDGDGALDAFLGEDERATIWLNDGRGTFRVSEWELVYSRDHAPAVGDVDGNGTIDVVAGKVDEALVWLNDGKGEMRQQLSAKQPLMYLNEEAAIRRGVEVASKDEFHFTGTVEEPRNLRAERMTFEAAVSSLRAQGFQSPEAVMASPETVVWLVTMEGQWPRQFPPLEEGEPTREPYRYLAVLLEAESGDLLGLSVPR